MLCIDPMLRLSSMNPTCEIVLKASSLLSLSCCSPATVPQIRLMIATTSNTVLFTDVLMLNSLSIWPIIQKREILGRVIRITVT